MCIFIHIHIYEAWRYPLKMNKRLVTNMGLWLSLEIEGRKTGERDGDLSTVRLFSTGLLFGNYNVCNLLDYADKTVI